MIKIILVVYMLFLYSFINGQDFEWAIGAGTHIDDHAIGMSIDNEKNVYLSGYLNRGTSIGDTTFDSEGAYITKISPNGEVQWVKKFGDYYTYAIDITIDSQDDVYLMGTYRRPISIEGYSLECSGYSSTFVLKLDKYGNVIWLKDFGRFMGRSIKIDKNYCFYIAGNYEYDLTINDSTYNLRGREGFDSDLVIMKFDNDAELQWIRNLGSLSEEYIYDMDIDQSGIVVVGNMHGNQLESQDTSF
ncbi:MAG: hypothetical protein GY756_14470 [bacterium]|nr:hypothetical protein [bacterium]